MWDPQTYLRYSDERARPFFDLLGQVPLEHPVQVVDLGCGTGHLTRTLCDRWPGAKVLGIDSSPEMLSQACAVAIPNRLEFQQGEIAGWSSQERFDLIFSNAALHWVGDHAELLPRLVNQLTEQGCLAVQMPNRFRSLSQKIIDEVAGDSRWSSILQGVGLHPESVLPISDYVSCLQDLGFRVNAWETTYCHVLRGENPVLEWVSGTGLRPLVQALPEDLKPAFLEELGGRFQKGFPRRGETTLFPFPRLFFVATR